jgi:hypothetical protein
MAVDVVRMGEFEMMIVTPIVFSRKGFFVQPFRHVGGL